ncbi:uncharacterized protein LOC113472469, partial [Diaphorina citri]
SNDHTNNDRKDNGGGGGGGGGKSFETSNTSSPPHHLYSSGSNLGVPKQDTNPNLLSPEILNQRRGSRRPSILPVPDMFTSSTLNIAASIGDGDEDGDESEDEMEDDVPWRSPSEKIA